MKRIIPLIIVMLAGWSIGQTGARADGGGETGANASHTQAGWYHSNWYGRP